MPVNNILESSTQTLPDWVLRVAYDGEEWLVLARGVDQKKSIRCEIVERRAPGNYAVALVTEFKDCVCGCHMRHSVVRGAKSLFDSLDEADAAFERVEAEWRASKEARDE